MNDDLDDRRLRRAVREALNDIVATAPTAESPHRRRRGQSRPARSNRWLHAAAGLTAAAGVVGIVVVASRDDEPPAAGESSSVPSSAIAPALTNPTTSTDGVPTTTAPSATTAVAVPGSTPADGECGAATVLDGATNVQSIGGDIDGDAIEDTVTLYAIGDQWRVHITSSVASSASDAPIQLTLGAAIETATVTLADIDSPAAIMVTAEGPNTLGIDANFTFLTLNTEYCVEQWIYRNAQDVDEPFEWIALREPGHVTGMICEGTSTPRTYRLVDSEQNADGTWRVINRILTHDFTRAEISFPPVETVADSPDFASEYGSIVNCD